MDPDGLPFVDEHRIRVAAPAAAVWRALSAQIPGFAGNATLARLLGAEPRRPAGTGLADGTAFAGFTVAGLVPGRRVRLAGRHRFSRYALVLELDPGPDATGLTARTYAAFPGVAGGLYRRLVIGSGAHRVLVRRLLRTVGRRAERDRAAR